METKIRPALDADCEMLTQLVQQSTAYEGEYHKLIADIVFTPAHLQRDAFFVCETDGQVAGFYSLKQKGAALELDFLFVDNSFQGQGIGGQLMAHMQQEAHQRGYQQVEIVAHPPAEAFYLKMGAVRVGVKPAEGRATWERPILMLSVSLASA